MTKPQIWVAAFLALFLLLFFLGRITNENFTMKNVPQMGAMPQQSNELSSQDLSGADLVKKLGCINCHGTELTGTKLAPNLTGVKQYWSRDRLINYLRNPSAFMSSDRFHEYRKKYPSAIMPPFGNINVKDLGKVADFVLSL